jgi:hypothetical protein
VRIVQWIDKILQDSIEASPHTTPNKTNNGILMAYQTHIKQGFQFGSESDDFELVDGEDVRHYQVVFKGERGYLVTPLDAN